VQQGHPRFVALCGVLVTLVTLAGCGGEVPTATPQIVRDGPPAGTVAPLPPVNGRTDAAGATLTRLPQLPPFTPAPGTGAATSPTPITGVAAANDGVSLAATATGFASMSQTMQAATSAASRPTVAPPTAMQAASMTRPTAASTTAPMVALAPEIAIPEAGKWFNSEPLSLAKLRGTPVLLVFWSDI